MWVRLPKHFRPKELDELYQDPVCRLVYSLNGHPEAGLFWEEHSFERIRREDIVDIPKWKSSFFHAETKLACTIYVDDFILSGPEQHHAPM